MPTLSFSSLSRPDRVVSVLSIAGSDSGAAAGVQADLKTFAAHAVHGLTAITAITAQTSHTVTMVRPVSVAALIAQLDAVRDDFHIGAIKIGMLGTARNVRAVADWLRAQRMRNVVLDPVLISTSGRRLLATKAVGVLRDELLPLIDILTPNLPEAETLLGQTLRTEKEFSAAAHDLAALGARAVLLKGGHFDATSPCVRDLFFDGRRKHFFTHPRRDFDARGTGCTLSAAIAAGLALGLTPLQSVRRAERYLQTCLDRAYRAGRSSTRVPDHLAALR